MADYGDDEEGVMIKEVSDSDFVENHGDPVVCIIQRLLCNQETYDTMHRHQILYSRCSVKSKVCNLVIDNKSCENIVFKALVDYLKVETEPHRHPCIIGWIKKGPSIQVINLYHVLILIGKFYQDFVACDVDMDKCYILLGRS